MFWGSTFCLIIRVQSLETKEKKSTRGNYPRVGYSTEWPYAPLDVRLRALEAAPPVLLPLIGNAKLLTFQQTSKKFSKNFLCSTTYKKKARILFRALDLFGLSRTACDSSITSLLNLYFEASSEIDVGICRYGYGSRGRKRDVVILEPSIKLIIRLGRSG